MIEEKDPFLMILWLMLAFDALEDYENQMILLKSKSRHEHIYKNPLDQFAFYILELVTHQT